MSGASLIPTDAPNEHEDVADLLSIARVTWNRGDHAAAVSFVQRAAQAAIELELELRGLELAKAAAELKATLSIVPAPPVRASNAPSPTTTPPLVLTPRAPDAPPASEEPETVRRDTSHMPQPAPQTSQVPKPPETNPGLGFLTAADEVDLDAPQRDTSIDVPPAHMLTPPIKVAQHAPRVDHAPRPDASPAPPRVSPSMTPQVVPRASAAPSPSPAATTVTRPSAGPPPVPPPRTQSVAPRTSVAPVNGSPAPPRVSPSMSPAPPRTAANPRPSVTPPATATAPTTSAHGSPSRAPLPLRVQGPQPSVRPVAQQTTERSPHPPAAKPQDLPPPPARGMIAPAVDPTPSMRKSAPWIDEVVGPIVAEGGAPVVVGVRARVHFRTDGSLEIGPDVESAGGLPVIVLPQRGEDMSTLLKRLKR